MAFDFDGVIALNGAGLHKPAAYDVVLGSYGEDYKLAQLEAETLYGSGKKGGRKEILEYVFRKMGESEEAIEAFVAKALEQFDEYVQEGILKDGLVVGVLPALKELSRRGISLYLNSGTATEALKLSARNLNIDCLFVGILGSSASKVDNLLYIAEKEGADFPEILVVGDGDSDVEAARELGCSFIGVTNCWNQWVKEEKPFPLVTDLREILGYI